MLGLMKKRDETIMYIGLYVFIVFSCQSSCQCLYCRRKYGQLKAIIIISAAVFILCVAVFVGLAAVIKGVTATSHYSHANTAEVGLFTGNASDVTTAPNTSLAATVTSADTSHIRDEHDITTLSLFNIG
jgi:hypothetical protein